MNMNLHLKLPQWLKVRLRLSHMIVLSHPSTLTMLYVVTSAVGGEQVLALFSANYPIPALLPLKENCLGKMLCLGIIKKRRERMVLCRVPYFMFRCAGEQHGSRTGGVLRPPEDGIPRWPQQLLQTWPACPWKSQIVFFFICCVWVTSFEH